MKWGTIVAGVTWVFYTELLIFLLDCLLFAGILCTTVVRCRLPSSVLILSLSFYSVLRIRLLFFFNFFTDMY